MALVSAHCRSAPVIVSAEKRWHTAFSAGDISGMTRSSGGARGARIFRSQALIIGSSLYMARGETISSRPMRASATTLEPEISNNELARLVALLRAERFRGAHLEIGTAAGGTLRELMRVYPDETRPRFVVVDPMTYFPDQLAKVRRNLKDAGLDPDRVDFRVTKSWPALHEARHAGEMFSFIFVDGAHKMRYVTEDIAWAELLEPGGIVCF